jgi:hypothetical protein
MAQEQIGTAMEIGIPSGLKITGYVVESVEESRTKETEDFKDEEGEVLTLIVTNKGKSYNYSLATKDTANVAALSTSDTISINSVTHFLEDFSISYSKGGAVAIVSITARKPDSLTIT